MNRPQRKHRPPERFDRRRNRGLTKEAQGEETRRNLIAAARQLFGKFGYANTSTERILREAGVTRGALYYHFGDKADLMRAVCDDLYAEVNARIVERADVATTAWDSLVAGCDAFLDVLADRAIVQTLFVDGPAVLGWEVWDAVERQHGFASLIDGIAAAMNAGDLARQPVEPLAVLLNGAMNSAVYWATRQSKQHDAIKQMRAAFRHVLDAVRLSARAHARRQENS